MSAIDVRSPVGPSRHEILRLVSVAFGRIADMAGRAVGSTRSRLTHGVTPPPLIDALRKGIRPLHCILERSQRRPADFGKRSSHTLLLGRLLGDLFSNHGAKLGFVRLSYLGRRKNIEFFDPLRDFVFGDSLREQKFSQFL
jgi:hypothetical protein